MDSIRFSRGVLRRVAVVVALVGTLALGSAACSASSTTGSRSSAPQLADPSREATALVTAWLTALQRGDKAEIAGFLAPNFLIQRADGSTSNRDQYLLNPPKVGTFTLGPEMVGIQDGDSLTVRWSVEVDEIINGKPFHKGEAARLTGFHWTGARWQIASYANFNVPT